MSTARNYRIVEFFVRNPIVGVIAFLAAGIWMTSGALKTGAKNSRFANGPHVAGTVVELRPDFQAAVRWTTPPGRAQSGVVDLYRNEYEALRAGSRIDLILASDNPAEAMTTERLSGHEPVTIAGIAMDPLGFGGIALMLIGLLFPVMIPRLQKEMAGAA